MAFLDYEGLSLYKENSDALYATDIVIDGAKANKAGSVGQYAILKNSSISGLDNGLYKITAAFTTSTTITSSYITAAENGGLNDVSAKLGNSSMGTTATTVTGAIAEHSDLFAPKASPVFTGSISLGRKDGTTVGDKSFAVGQDVTASGSTAHAEGVSTAATWNSAHAEGAFTEASGYTAHAEGFEADALGAASHAEGWYTKATHKAQHVFGEYNAEDGSTNSSSKRGNYVEIVGNGQLPSGTTTPTRSNARTLDWDGNEELAGDLTIDKDSANPISLRSLNSNIAKLQNELGIVCNGNKCTVSATIGQYIILKNSTISGCADGLYTATQAIPANTAITSAYLSAVSNGGLNALNDRLTMKDITNELTWATAKLNTYHAWLSGNIVFLNFRTYENAIIDSNVLVTIPMKYRPAQDLFLYGVSWASGGKAQQAFLQHSSGQLYFVGEAVNAGAYTAITVSYPI